MCIGDIFESFPRTLDLSMVVLTNMTAVQWNSVWCIARHVLSAQHTWIKCTGNQYLTVNLNEA